MLNPVHLRTFLAVKKLGSYTRASRELFLSQPAVSRQVHQLEEELGVTLFETFGKTLHTTDAGRFLEAHATRVLADLDRVAEAVRARQGAVIGSLRIGASTTPGLYLLPDTLPRLRTKFPELDVRYSVERSSQIQRRLLANELDLGFVGGDVTDPSLRKTPFARDRIVCCVGVDHPLAKRRRIDPAALEGHTWVTREHGSSTRAWVQKWLDKVGIEMTRRIELPSPESVKVLVRAGAGIGFLSSHALQDERGRRALRSVAVSGLRLHRRIHCVRHVDKGSTPAVEAFLALTRA